jgi:hypothetical protein
MVTPAPIMLDGIVPGAAVLPTEIWFAPPPSLREENGTYKVDAARPSPLAWVSVIEGAVR